MAKKMTKSEKLLRDLFVASKNLGYADNYRRSYPSVKSFNDYYKAEQKLMLAEQLAEEYLMDNEIEFKLKTEDK
jgi:hypothetical protein